MMTKVNFTLDLDDIKEQIEDSPLESTLKAATTMALNMLMKKEQEEFINAKSHEQSTERNGRRNGYYSRSLLTSAGKLILDVPRVRDSEDEFSVSIFEKYERIDQAFILSMIEMVVNGVSTRSVEKIVKHCCGNGVSKSVVSDLCKRLDPIVDEWRNRSLENESYPYIFVDAMYIKVRELDRVVSKAVHIASAVRSDGRREVLGMHLSDGESESTWKAFFESLKDRGIKNPKMIISDAHAGLKAAVRSCFTGTSWQRCFFHLTRNIFQTFPKKGTTPIRNQIRDIFNAPTIDLARERKNILLDKYGFEKKYQKGLEILDEAFEDATQFYHSNVNPKGRLRTTSGLERLNQEVRKREKTIKIFPNDESAIRLIGSILMEIDKKYKTSRMPYIYDLDSSNA